MSGFIKISLLAVSLMLMTGSALALTSTSDWTNERSQKQTFQGVLVAKGEKKKSGSGREKFLTGEGRSKKGTKTKIDFDDAQIDGSRRTPTGVSISKNDPNRQYDLINLRYHWKPEMIQSAAGLETGKGR